MVDSSGRPISRARISLTNSTGDILTAVSNSFGYFRINDVAVGETYLLSAAAKGYKIQPQVVQVTDDIADIRLIAHE